MHFLNFINESEGITNRKMGDIFADQHNNFYKFEKLIRQPQEGKTFNSVEELDKDVAKQIAMIEKEHGKKRRVIENNKKTDKAKSYLMIVLLDMKENTPLVIIKYLDRPASIQNKWTSGDLKDAKKMPEIQLSLYKGASSKSDVNSAIVQVSHIYDDMKMSSSDIIKKTQLAFDKQKEPTKKEILGALLNLLQDIANGGLGKYIATNMKKFQNVFDVSLAEVIVPMALLTISKGKNKSLFLADSISNLENCIGVPFQGFKGLKVIIPTKSNEKLVDSKIYDGSEKLFGISNKAGKGAAASISNVVDGLNKLKEVDKKQYDALMKKYPTELKVLNIIAAKENTAVMGVLLVAKELGIINDEEVQQAINTIKTNSSKGISKNLFKLMSDVGSNTNLGGYHVGKHLVTGIAKKVSRTANSDDKYKELIAKILMSAKFVQASPVFRANGNDLILSGIKLLWPPVVKSVKVDYNKNFTATHIRGKLSFIVH